MSCERKVQEMREKRERESSLFGLVYIKGKERAENTSLPSVY